MLKTYVKKSINKFGYEIRIFTLVNNIQIAKNTFHF